MEGRWSPKGYAHIPVAQIIDQPGEPNVDQARGELERIGSGRPRQVLHATLGTSHLLFKTSLQFWWRAPCAGHPDQTIHKDVSAWQIFYQNVRRILMTKRFPSTKTNITAILHSSQITSSA